MFRLVVEQGIFEYDNVRLIQRLIRPESTMLDVGANIGLMAIPALATGRCNAVSFEPSPNSLPFLRKTISESHFKDRWKLVESAVGAAIGYSSFSVSAQPESVFDGIKHTGRAPYARTVTVPLTTLDHTWDNIGAPPVSVIKIDTEGSDLSVLHGSVSCIAACRPYIMLEWQSQNLSAYGTPKTALLDFARETGNTLLAVPSLAIINDPSTLAYHMRQTESFLLANSPSSLYNIF